MSSWGLVIHEDSNSNAEGKFRSTLGYLSFTGYEMALSCGSHGARGAEVYYLETLVSVHDRGEWIADIDILATAANAKLVRYKGKFKGSNGDNDRRKRKDDILGDRFSGNYD